MAVKAAAARNATYLLYSLLVFWLPLDDRSQFVIVSFPLIEHLRCCKSHGSWFCQRCWQCRLQLFLQWSCSDLPLLLFRSTLWWQQWQQISRCVSGHPWARSLLARWSDSKNVRHIISPGKQFCSKLVGLWSFLFSLDILRCRCVFHSRL